MSGNSRCDYFLAKSLLFSGRKTRPGAAVYDTRQNVQ